MDRTLIRRGMVVSSSDGHRLGRVLETGDVVFVVEKGGFFAVDYAVRYEDVTDVSDDEIHLSRARADLASEKHVFAREGGLGESFTVGVAGGAEEAGIGRRPVPGTRGK